MRRYRVVRAALAEIAKKDAAANGVSGSSPRSRNRFATGVTIVTIDEVKKLRVGDEISLRGLRAIVLRVNKASVRVRWHADGLTNGLTHRHLTGPAGFAAVFKSEWQRD